MAKRYRDRAIASRTVMDMCLHRLRCTLPRGTRRCSSCPTPDCPDTFPTSRCRDSRRTPCPPDSSGRRQSARRFHRTPTFSPSTTAPRPGTPSRMEMGRESRACSRLPRRCHRAPRSRAAKAEASPSCRRARRRTASHRAAHRLPASSRTPRCRCSSRSGRSCRGGSSRAAASTAWAPHRVPHRARSHPAGSRSTAAGRRACPCRRRLRCRSCSRPRRPRREAPRRATHRHRVLPHRGFLRLEHRRRGARPHRGRRGCCSRPRRPAERQRDARASPYDSAKMSRPFE
jgi:hypothetical protein